MQTTIQHLLTSKTPMHLADATCMQWWHQFYAWIWLHRVFVEIYAKLRLEVPPFWSLLVWQNAGKCLQHEGFRHWKGKDTVHCCCWCRTLSCDSSFDLQIVCTPLQTMLCSNEHSISQKFLVWNVEYFRRRRLRDTEAVEMKMELCGLNLATIWSVTMSI